MIKEQRNNNEIMKNRYEKKLRQRQIEVNIGQIIRMMPNEIRWLNKIEIYEKKLGYINEVLRQIEIMIKGRLKKYREQNE